MDRAAVKALIDLRISDVSSVHVAPPPRDPAALPPEVRAALRQTPIPQALTNEDGDLDTELLEDIDDLRDEEEDSDQCEARAVDVLDVEIIDYDPAWLDDGAPVQNWRYITRRAVLTDSDERESDSESDERAWMSPSEYSDGCEGGSGSRSRYSDGEW
jgi:hypothetical protein